MADNISFPEIPNKLYFNIGEVSKICKIKQHVLRYWEQEFNELKPSKRTGGRRYYQKKDVQIVCYIKDLLYNKGFTISGAKKQLKNFKPTNEIVPENNNVANKIISETTKIITETKNSSHDFLQQVISELENLLQLLKNSNGA